MSLAARMAAIFVGNSAGHYTADFTNATTDDKGKVKLDYVSRPGAPTEQAFTDHLAGKLGLLVVPIAQDGMCSWGKIDLDNYAVDHALLAKRIAKAGLPLVLERSKSGGCHLALYLRHPVPAEQVREQLAEIAARLGLPANVEIFPKQYTLNAGNFGSGINLPYFGGDSAKNYAIDERGNRLTVSAWLDLIEKLRGAPVPRAATVNVELAGSILAEHWTDRRNELNLYALGTMLREGVDTPEAQAIVDYAMELAGDEEQGTEHRRTAENVARELERGVKKIPGQTKLRERLGDEATDAFLAAIGESGRNRLPLTFDTIQPAFLDTPPPAVSFTIDPFLAALVVMLLIAEGGTGKTNFGLLAAMCVAMGRKFFDMEVTRGRAIYVGMEDNTDALRRRFHWMYQRTVTRMQQEKASPEAIDAMRTALLANFSMESAVGHELHLVRMHDGQAIQSPLVERLIRRIPRDTSLLVLDPMSRLNGAEENSNAVGTAMINAAERIAREVGCSVMIAHHTGKAAAKDRDESAYAARGASGFADAARSVVRMITANSDDLKNFSNVDEAVVARGEIIKVVHAKCNDAARAPEFWLRRQGHDFDLWVPEISRGGGAERDLRALLGWWHEEQRRPFTRTNVVALRATIFGAGATEARARAALANGLQQGVIVPTGEVAARAHHEKLTFREDYDPDGL